MFKNRLNLRKLATIIASLAVTTLFVACDKTNGNDESREKQISAFSFANPSATGVINETAKTIAIEVPCLTNVTSLTPAITISANAKVSPASDVAQNFTNPVVYTVTAEDGSTALYTVTVIKNCETEGDDEYTGEVEQGAVRYKLANSTAVSTFKNYYKNFRQDTFQPEVQLVTIYDNFKLTTTGYKTADEEAWIDGGGFEGPDGGFTINEKENKKDHDGYMTVAGKVCKVFKRDGAKVASWNGIIMYNEVNGVVVFEATAATLTVPNSAFTKTFSVTWI